MQAALFEYLSNNLPSKTSLVKEISKILSIETDSAYRRIRGQTALTFDEGCKLINKYNIPIDSLIYDNVSPNKNISFYYQQFDQNDLEEYLNFLLKRFKTFDQAKESSFIVTAQDIPSFYFFIFPELRVFKAYFYFRVIQEVEFKPFDFKDMQRILNTLGKDLPISGDHIIEAYMQVPSIEIWNENTMDGHFNHIRYSWESGFFKDKKNALLIVDKTSALLDHIKKQAQKEKKFMPETLVNEHSPKYEMYHSEGLQLENKLLFRNGQSKKSYLISNTGDYLLTSNENFYNRNFHYINNTKKNSSKISDSGEKNRNKLFRKFHERLSAVRALIEHS